MAWRKRRCEDTGDTKATPVEKTGKEDGGKERFFGQEETEEAETLVV